MRGAKTNAISIVSILRWEVCLSKSNRIGEFLDIFASFIKCHMNFTNSVAIIHIDSLALPTAPDAAFFMKIFCIFPWKNIKCQYRLTIGTYSNAKDTLVFLSADVFCLIGRDTFCANTMADFVGTVRHSVSSRLQIF